MRRRWSGFTLIELVTVTAIVSLLAAILLPAVATVKRAAGRSNCSFNLHGIGVAFGQYVSAHGVYPTYGSSQTSRVRNYLLADRPGMEDWTALHVGNHLSSVEMLFCPAMKSANHQFDTAQNPMSAGTVRTGYSRRFLPVSGDGLTHAEAVRPGQVLAADLLVTPGRLKYQHEDGANVLYDDGTVVFRGDVIDLFAGVGITGNKNPSNSQLDAVWSKLDR